MSEQKAETDVTRVWHAGFGVSSVKWEQGKEGRRENHRAQETWGFSGLCDKHINCTLQITAGCSSNSLSVLLLFNQACLGREGGELPARSLHSPKELVSVEGVEKVVGQGLLPDKVVQHAS